MIGFRIYNKCLKNNNNKDAYNMKIQMNYTKIKEIIFKN